MPFAVKCLIGLAVLAAPCAYDSAPGEPSAIAAIFAPASPAKAMQKPADVPQQVGSTAR
jgi:hypothetical protein